MNVPSRAGKGPARPRGGCGFLVLTCLFSSLFLIVNGELVRAVYAWLSPVAPALLRSAKMQQGILFVGTVLLLFVEWWLVDFLTERFSRIRQAVGGRR